MLVLQFLTFADEACLSGKVVSNVDNPHTCIEKISYMTMTELLFCLVSSDAWKILFTSLRPKETCSFAYKQE